MVKNKNHILYIPRWYPSKSDPMLGLFVKNHSKAAIAAGYHITVAYAVTSDDKSVKKITIEQSKEGNLNEIIAYYPSDSTFRAVQGLTAWFRALTTAIRLFGIPSLIHAHVLTRSGFIALLLSLRYRIPFIITEHWSRYFQENNSFKGVIRRLITKLVINLASSVTVVSSRLYSAMRSNGLNFPKHILPNVVDTDLFNISVRKENKFRFISITCFEEKSKNLKMLIDASAIHRNSGYDFELILVGDGTDRELIERYSESKGLSVTFTGMLPPEQTAVLLKQSHCLVLSSNYETFGIVVYESLAAGVPVIATNVADLSDLIDKESGILVPVADGVALAQAMKSMQENYIIYDPMVLRNKVTNICSIDSVANQLNQLYQSFIK